MTIQHRQSNYTVHKLFRLSKVMLSSKELIELTDISRATLNNYIALGLLSRPLVLNPGTGAAGPRQLGFFPDETVERVRQIQHLKQEGFSMKEIAARIGAGSAVPTAAPTGGATIAALPSSSVRVTIEDIAYPAYMVNHNFELVWLNQHARTEFLAGAEELPAAGEERSIFRLFAASSTTGLDGLLRFQVALAKSRVSPAGFAAMCHGMNPEDFSRLQRVYADATGEPARPVVDAWIDFPGADGQPLRRHIYASFFREGIFVVLIPDSEDSDSIQGLLARRDEVIRSLLRHRLPVLTHLAVLVADLQSSVKICSELPPDEYFKLINEIWAAMEPIFRKYHATHGKHVGDGMVYYFFPQPDSDYLFNALCCAQEVRREMIRISKAWQIAKNWHNELYLNTGIHEGQEWLGTFQSSTSVEFVVLGDTINQAARVSDFARYGSIWATKSLVGKLSREIREKVQYGVSRRGADGRDTFVTSSFAMVSSLQEQSGEHNEKLRDIATLPITQIVEVAV
ncbi:MAG: adenylate/guanylate cyclase domain-containing protein [Rhodocyclaceae bacterium]|nr:adenylate/guanylate cyclase domain-containing protein [Rhodocyclaceae bacterium]